MRRQLFALTVLVLLFGCGGGGGGSDDSGSESSGSFSADACSTLGLRTAPVTTSRGETPDVKIANGQICSVQQDTESPLVGLEILLAEGFSGICSGTVISPTKILTAAHCLEGTVLQISAITSAGIFSVADAFVNQDYRIDQTELGGLLTNDIAVVVTTQPMPIPPMPLLLSRPPVIGEEGVIGGVGEIAPGESSDALRAGNVVVQNVTPSHIFVVFEDNQSHPCNGDSGGPLVVFNNGQPAVAGVVSQSDPQVAENGICRPGDITLYTNIQSDSSLRFLSLAAPEASSL